MTATKQEVTIEIGAHTDTWRYVATFNDSKTRTSNQVKTKAEVVAGLDFVFGKDNWTAEQRIGDF